ncbi:MAG: succinate dehydrogenase hydrophobic anchor subunit [Gammaproteobacteria bacterium]|jgi:succinate dehydrogenase hydrophobic anchor subunit|tara:strand:+ start:1047 stop:1220 length:174 start_codon:yes stop_codon:yes gene_type:complete
MTIIEDIVEQEKLENEMDVLVSVIAVIVAAGCFIAILLSDLKSKSKKPASEPSKDEQ